MGSATAARRGRPGRILAALACAGLLLLLTGLASIASSERSGQLDYQLIWDWGRAEATATGWRTVNDLGYRIEVTNGYLVSHSAALLACTPAELGPWERLIDSISAGLGLDPAIAQAGHSALDAEPTQVIAPVGESLDRPRDADLGAVVVQAPARAYCQAHYAIGRAAGDGIEGGSIHLEGRFRSDAGAWQAFELDSALAWGHIAVIRTPDETENEEETSLRLVGDAPVRIEIHRDLGALFDSVDFEAMDAETRAKAVLLALARSTRFEWIVD